MELCLIIGSTDDISLTIRLNDGRILIEVLVVEEEEEEVVEVGEVVVL